MITIALILHLIFAIALIVVVLLQRSEGGALGIGGGGGGGGGLVSRRGAGNFLTRATGVLAACFIATSLALAILAQQSSAPRSFLDGTGAVAPAQDDLVPGQDLQPLQPLAPAQDAPAQDAPAPTVPAPAAPAGESLTPSAAPEN